MLALVLQITPEEIPQADELINLITDIEPVVRKDCEFILYTRKDVEVEDYTRLKNRLQTKFSRARAIECWDFATGWPHGPNTMWCCLIRQLFHMRRMDELAADGALSFECDCIPVKPNWINLLAEAWNEAKASGKEATGHFHGGTPGSPGSPTHMNGNAIFATNFWDKHQDMTGCHGQLPWDVVFSPIILKVAVDTPRIDQWYRMDHFSQKDWDRIAKTPCALFHGVKVPDGRRIAREQLCQTALPQPQGAVTPTSTSKSRRSQAS
jgi:hypothetical protein